MSTHFEFAFAPAYKVPALLLGIRPTTAYVGVSDEDLLVRFGPWSLLTRRDNVVGAELTGGFSWLKTAGPPHLSLADRGVTFATNGDRAVCLRFGTPVAAIEPTGTIRHPGATLTVAQPELLLQALTTGG